MKTKQGQTGIINVITAISKVAAIGLLLTISSCTICKLPTFDPKKADSGEILRPIEEALVLHKTKPVKLKEGQL